MTDALSRISYLTVWCLMFCLISYGLFSDVLSRTLRFGVLYFVSYLMVWCLMVYLLSNGLVSDILSRILWFVF